MPKRVAATEDFNKNVTRCTSHEFYVQECHKRSLRYLRNTEGINFQGGNSNSSKTVKEREFRRKKTINNGTVLRRALYKMAASIKLHSCEKVEKMVVQLCQLMKHRHSGYTGLMMMKMQRVCFHTSPHPPSGRPVVRPSALLVFRRSKKKRD